MVTLESLKNDPDITALIKRADDLMGVIGYTEHGMRHCTLTSNISRNVLSILGDDERVCELAGIAAYMHDLGNVVNRNLHAEYGSILAFQLLTARGMSVQEAVEVAAAIGYHDENTGGPISRIGSAVILADKSDVHESRVRDLSQISSDIHDRVNYAAKSSFLRINAEEKTASLEITIDTAISQVMEYFEIFLSRMSISRQAAKFLGLRYELEINGFKLL
jgi:metal-dependent HD superfamily phosphatase/phosphodiesterase